MNRRNKLARYRENAVLGSRPEEMVPLLYEHLVVNLRRAEEQIAEGDIEGKCASIQKALDILHELLASLDFEDGGEIASRLASLYSYFIRELGEIGNTLDRERLAKVLEMVNTLYESWRDVAREAGAAEPEAPA